MTAAGVAWLAFYCVSQRRRGIREARAAEAAAEGERQELAAYKAAGFDPDKLSEQTEYNPAAMRQEGTVYATGYNVPGDTSEMAAEKWGGAAAAGAAGAAGAAATPLLRNEDRSPPNSPERYGSPPSGRSITGNISSPPPSAMRSPSQQQFGAIQSPNRSASIPNSQMRVGSPSVQENFGGPLRTQSPAQTFSPPPRSVITDGSRPQPGSQGGYGNGGGGFL